MKTPGITQNEQEHFIFIVAPQLANANGAEFTKK